ncbi:HNH endonuclease [Methylorubrum thiocyanatum]|uniref:HNH endonuclease n=1 Tax=Methylorubrum thiocyanatum TaxID=47958 RepID=UPI003F7D68A0
MKIETATPQSAQSAPQPKKSKTTRVQRLRAEAYARQKKRCYWCGKTNLHPIKPGEPWDPDALTAEHLVRKADGGKDTAKNIVAACAQCNTDRERWPDGIPRVRVKAITRPHIFCAAG